jgi:hypothetical protein
MHIKDYNSFLNESVPLTIPTSLSMPWKEYALTLYGKANMPMYGNWPNKAVEFFIRMGFLTNDLIAIISSPKDFPWSIENESNELFAILRIMYDNGIFKEPAIEGKDFADGCKFYIKPFAIACTPTAPMAYIIPKDAIHEDFLIDIAKKGLVKWELIKPFISLKKWKENNVATGLQGMGF